MPGSSRLPVSLRDTQVKAAASRRIIILNIGVIRNIVFFLFILRWSRKVFRQLKGRGLVGTATEWYTAARRAAYTLLLRAPGIREKVQAQIADARSNMKKKLMPSGPDVERYLTLPAEGWDAARVKQELTKLQEMKHTRWEDGRVSGAVYHGGSELAALQTEAFGMFTVSNPLHPDVFPAVRKMEAEVVAMVLALFNAPPEAGGVTTAGGTESILMACLGARNKAYKERRVTEPEMIVPETAHAAFRKAAQFFKIKLHLVECRAPSHKVHMPSVARLVNDNTILLVGSAPNYPHGIIDDIAALSRLAVKRNVPLHVDCCLGSFLVPYLEKAGFDSEPFDFRLPGVTSISCDTHKYGFAPKGNSTVLYRSTQLRAYQYFVTPDWSGGVYGSAAIAGSRPGALIAGCWASMMSTGVNGYIDACHRIVGTAKNIEAAIRTDTDLNMDLRVIGRPLVSVVAFSSPTIDIYAVADGMSAKGWHLNALQNPPAVHIAVTLPVVGSADQLITDLKAVVFDVNESERQRLAAGKAARGSARGTASALYGVAGALPTKAVVEELAVSFLDILYEA